jgi:integrase
MKPRITDLEIKKARPAERPRKLWVGDGLFLLITQSGGKYWRLRWKVGSKERCVSLGTYPAVSLKEAQEKAVQARRLIEAGNDPVVERRLIKARNTFDTGNTFEVVAREWFEVKAARLAPSYFEKVRGTIESNLFPWLGKLPVESIDAPMLLKALRVIEARDALELTARCRRWAGAIFDYAIATGRRSGENPATAIRKDVLKSPTAKNYPHLEREALGEFLRKLDGYSGRPETRLALQFLILTFVRSGELRFSKWDEFDLERGEWRIPAERMKMRREHWVPLSRQALAVLGELRVFTGHSAYLLPGGRDRLPVVSENTLNKAIAQLGYKGKVVAHGFRSSASSILNESNLFNPDAIERQLAHREANSVRAAYHRAEYREERRKLMQWWADCLDGLRNGAEIIPLHRGKMA